MKPQFYHPETPVTGPAYSTWFKLLASLVTAILIGYGIVIATRFPLGDYSFGVKALLAGALVMLLVSYYWFLKARITIDEKGIRQTGLITRTVEWSDVRGVKLIGIPYLTAIFPPRLVVRTGVAFATFNGGTRELLIEFTHIALAYKVKR